MARALEEQRRHADAADLGFEERVAMLVEREALERDSKGGWFRSESMAAIVGIRTPGRYLDFHIGRRPHSSLGARTPEQAYMDHLPQRVAA